VEAGNALVAFDGNLDIGEFRNLLNGKVVSNGASAIPHKVMDRSQGFGAANDPVEEIVDGFLEIAQQSGEKGIGWRKAP
jgi:hypothetical protein